MDQFTIQVQKQGSSDTAISQATPITTEKNLKSSQINLGINARTKSCFKLKCNPVKSATFEADQLRDQLVLVRIKDKIV